MNKAKQKTIGQALITVCVVMLLAGLVTGSLPTLTFVTKYENWKITVETYPPSTGAPYEKRLAWKCDENWKVITYYNNHGYGVFIKAGETATARCRLVIAKSPTDEQIVELYKKYIEAQRTA